jgi:glycosyltransferase involved in cell wall biosynthesis
VAAPAASAPPAPRLVVVVPCYNEERRLDAAAFRSFDRDRLGLRFCFVDDGSRDGTLALLQRLVAEAPGLGFVLALGTNHGKAEAVRRGLLAALDTGASYVGFWDADLATPLDELPYFEGVLDQRPQVDIVLGSRVRLLGRHIERRAVRHYLGRVFATGASTTLGLAVYDTQCGAKVFRATPRLRALVAERFLTSWVFDVEILARYVRSLRGEPGLPAAERIYELPLRRWTDVPGSKVKAWDFVRSAVELLRIWNAYVRR